jgi:hypothetical protein
MKRVQLTEALYQGLETELGGTRVYETALRCVQNDELKEEWEKYPEQTKTHVEIMGGLFEAFHLDPEAMTPGPAVVLRAFASRPPTSRSKSRRTNTSTAPRAGAASSGSPRSVCRPSSRARRGKGVKTAIGAARAKQSRKDML